jgi:hypothetical protein
MFFLTLPKGERTGNCRINGQAAEFRVTAQAISFRYDGETDWQERRILDSSENGKLVQYFCDDEPSSEGPYCVIKPSIGPEPEDNELFYWLAINGPSVAASSIPMSCTVRVSPVPEQMIGFRSREEQLAIQKFLLTAPMSKVEKFMKEEMPRKLQNGEVVGIKLKNPEPYTTGQTLWGC